MLTFFHFFVTMLSRYPKLIQVDFLFADKHQSFLKVVAIAFGERDQVCP